MGASEELRAILASLSAEKAGPFCEPCLLARLAVIAFLLCVLIVWR